jgi:YHS domain-containing protein
MRVKLRSCAFPKLVVRRRFISAHARAHIAGMPWAKEVVMAVDPVCGVSVEPAYAAGGHAHDGHVYYFCSKQCLVAFRSAPGVFLRPFRATGETVADAPDERLARPPR